MTAPRKLMRIPPIAALIWLAVTIATHGEQIRVAVTVSLDLATLAKPNPAAAPPPR